MINKFDYVIIGSGIYGMYAAKLLSEKSELRILIVEYEDKPFRRASFINQARVHNGYHYPRSYATAISSAKYFKRFCNDFDFAINNRFKKIYAISNKYSLTSSEQFQKFCRHARIPCEEINPDKYFNANTVEAAFETVEYAFDAEKISDSLEDHLKKKKNVEFIFNVRIIDAEKVMNSYNIELSNGMRISTNNVINCTYASINQINQLFGFEKFRIKYEIAEIILCNVNNELSNVGITVMDGPFFSVMPFGDSGLNTLTAVTFTPHKTCYKNLPEFNCQKINKNCTTEILQNCNTCLTRPNTAFPHMHQLAKKYLKSNIEIFYESSLFAIKPILLASEIDDSRPTLIRTFSKEPGFITILSGKINTIYDMETVIV